MLKKVHASKSLNHIQKEEGVVQCLVCKNYSSTILYVSPSDHFLCNKCRGIGTPNQDGSVLKANNVDDLKLKRNKNGETKKTTIEYKNNNFNANDSSIDLLSMNIINHRNRKTYKQLHSNLSLARPVKCPVTLCNKMIAIDSTLQHFYFDHSKIARITLKPKKSQRIIQKSSIFTKDTQCIAIFIHQINPSDSCHQLTNSNNNFSSRIEDQMLLLMCAKKYLMSTKITNDTNISIKQDKTLQGKPKTFDDSDILLWLCKIGNNGNLYKITLSKEDKRLSYSFTGEAVHISGSQDANSIHDKSNCLIVRGVSANRLLDNDNQFHIFVSIV